MAQLAMNRPEVIQSLIDGVDRYNPDNISILEEYLATQCQNEEYDLMANLAALKLYVRDSWFAFGTATTWMLFIVADLLIKIKNRLLAHWNLRTVTNSPLPSGISLTPTLPMTELSSTSLPRLWPLCQPLISTSACIFSLNLWLAVLKCVANPPVAFSLTL